MGIDVKFIGDISADMYGATVFPRKGDLLNHKGFICEVSDVVWLINPNAPPTIEVHTKRK
jgi:hypothetical protein